MLGKGQEEEESQKAAKKRYTGMPPGTRWCWPSYAIVSNWTGKKRFWLGFIGSFSRHELKGPGKDFCRKGNTGKIYHPCICNLQPSIHMLEKARQIMSRSPVIMAPESMLPYNICRKTELSVTCSDIWFAQFVSNSTLKTN